MKLQGKLFVLAAFFPMVFLGSCTSPDVPKISDVPVFEEQKHPQTETWDTEELERDKQKVLEQRRKVLSNDELNNEEESTQP